MLRLEHHGHVLEAALDSASGDCARNGTLSLLTRFRYDCEQRELEWHRKS